MNYIEKKKRHLYQIKKYKYKKNDHISMKKNFYSKAKK
jgi:hypothetical protein